MFGGITTSSCFQEIASQPYREQFCAEDGTNILILTGNHLCNNPRVIKEGTTLANAGYTVTVIGAWFDAGLKARDLEMQGSLPFTFKPAIDGTENAPRRLRLRMKASRSIAYRFAGFENRSQLGYASHSLRAASRQPANLYIAHSEAAMAVAADLLHDGRLVGIDVEDWFSEDLPLEARKLWPSVSCAKPSTHC